MKNQTVYMGLREVLLDLSEYRRAVKIYTGKSFPEDLEQRYLNLFDKISELLHKEA